MKMNKSYILSFLFVFVLSIGTYAQSVKYVAYFPVPYISHQVITANTAYFAGKDEASVDVTGKLTGTNLVTDKDLLLTTTSSSSGSVSMLSAGANSDAKGKFVVNKASGQLTVSNVPTASVTNGPNVNEIKADESLKVSTIKWVKDNSTNYNGFLKGNTSQSSAVNTVSTTGFPTETKTLCWKPLRLKGSYEYQYYLIAINGTNCDTYTGL